MRRSDGFFNSFGLTGGIGAGKTTAAERFRQNGAVVLDADEISRHALDPETDCYRQTVGHFGERILSGDGSVDRKALASIVFADPAERKALNAIIHPYVLREMFRQRDEAVLQDPCAVVIFDIPLLIECGAFRDMCRNVVIVADDEVRIRRVMERNGISREQVLERIGNQIAQSVQAGYADYLIDNSGSLDDLYRQTDAVYEKLKELAR